jgi:hypothetical protein
MFLVYYLKATKKGGETIGNIKSILRRIKKRTNIVVCCIILILLFLHSSAAKTDVLTFLENDYTEQAKLTENYTSFNFAMDIMKNAQKQGIECKIVGVKYKKYDKIEKKDKIYTRYLNYFPKDKLLVDETGTTEGTGIDKKVTHLKKGEELKEKPLFTDCNEDYNKGIVTKVKVL